MRAHLIVTDAAARIGIHSRKDLGEAGVAPIEAVRRRRVGGAAAQDRAEGPCAATPLPAAADDLHVEHGRAQLVRYGCGARVVLADVDPGGGLE